MSTRYPLSSNRLLVLILSVFALGACDDGAELTSPDPARFELSEENADALDAALRSVLAEHGFTGRAADQMTAMGRPLNRNAADLGNLLFFDPILSLTTDNSCAGCHSPFTGLAGTQSIAIGVGNNGIVGPDRAGPRNIRRAPSVINRPLFPVAMLDARIRSLSGNPFDPSSGFYYPPPDDQEPAVMEHLLAGMTFLPVADRREMAGFDFVGSGSDIRAEITARLNGNEEYRDLFDRAFEDLGPDDPITFGYVAKALTEFLFSLVRADAPLDRFAQGDNGAMSDGEKKGALLFFGEARCAECHAVNVDFAMGGEMFTDYRTYVIGVPQIVPDRTNAVFDGPGADQDFGLEQTTRDPADRYAFRTAPLRNVALQPTFMHNGAYTTVEDATMHHFDPYGMIERFDWETLDPDLRRMGPMDDVLARLDPRIGNLPELSLREFDDLTNFVKYSLTSPRAKPHYLTGLIPDRVPSGLPVHTFQRVALGIPH